MDVLRKFSWLFILFFGLGAINDVASSKEIGPADDYCQEINNSTSGTEVILYPGEYKGACKVRRGGRPGFPLIIRALDLKKRPHIYYEGRNGNVLEIYADHILIRGLDLGPTHADVDGIRLFSGYDITIEDCVFDRMGGIAIVANHASVRRTIVRRNRITDSASTGMYFGCHDGEACAVSHLLIEKNLVSGITARESEIGYGIQLKLNSFGTVSDNVIVNTKGPGIMVYGAKDLSETSIVERNFVARSREASGIVIGGGPAIVRNNIVMGNSEAGIGLEDYGRRGLLRKIVVTHNTVYNNGRGGILARTEGAVEAEIFGNAVLSPAGTSPFPAEHEGLRVVRNQDCRNVACFLDPANKDFTPVKGSALVTIGENGTLRSSPLDDYFGKPRGDLPVIGAIEPPGGRIKLELKP
jgi:hypothetical protein